MNIVSILQSKLLQQEYNMSGQYGHTILSIVFPEQTTAEGFAAAYDDANDRMRLSDLDGRNPLLGADSYGKKATVVVDGERAPEYDKWVVGQIVDAAQKLGGNVTVKYNADEFDTRTANTAKRIIQTANEQGL